MRRCRETGASAGVRARGALRRLALAVLAAGWWLLGTPAAAEAPAVLRPLAMPHVPGLLDDGDAASLRDAVRQSLAWLRTQSPDRRLPFGPRTLTVAQQRRGLERLLGLLADDPPPETLEARVLEAFDVLASAGRADGSVLLTGYHEPVVDAAERPSREYAVPILGAPRPPGPAPPGRLPSRAEIEDGGLWHRGLALAWARDPVDVFFMEIEGSGTLRLPDGRLVRVGHASTNGHPYRSIGRLLVDEGRVDREAMSMQAIRAWLDANPRERARVLRWNPSYVFFRRLSGPPVGSLGVPLTPARSIATDARLFPPAALAFLRTERPALLSDGRLAWVPVSRFVLNQDTGGAIRGPGRADLFWGRGPEAELVAGLMKQLGDLYFLAPR